MLNYQPSCRCYLCFARFVAQTQLTQSLIDSILARLRFACTCACAINREHVASEAIRFIQESIEDNNQPFFLYCNPSVPHNSGDVTTVLESGDCRHTVEGLLDEAPPIPYGAPDDYNTSDCRAYRESVLNRTQVADVRRRDKEAGTIWIDDSIGWIFATLEALGELNNTFFLFQQDHGFPLRAGNQDGPVRSLPR